MSLVGKKERITQNRITKLFQQELKYEYLVDWTERPENKNIEKEYLHKYLIDKNNIK